MEGMNCKYCGCDWCDGQGEDYVSDICEWFRPMTNADKIRLMDDDKLAVFLGNTKAFCCRDRDPSEEFIAEFKEWLVKEAGTNDS